MTECAFYYHRCPYAYQLCPLEAHRCDSRPLLSFDAYVAATHCRT